MTRESFEYFFHIAILVGIYTILAQGFNLSFGLGRLFNLAHVAVYAIGAYTTALLTTSTGASLFVCLTASTLLAGLCALVFGAIALRLQADYFAIGTLALSLVVSAFLINWRSLTAGVLGIPGIPRPEFWQIDFNQNSNFLIFVILCSLCIQIPFFFLYRGQLHRTLRAQGEFELAAMSLGVDTRWYRTTAFFLSSCCAGLGGSLYAYYMSYIDPSSFSLNEMIFILTIVVVGRPGSFWGVLAATVFLVCLPEPLRFIELPPGVLGPLRQLMYAGILLLVIGTFRASLFPKERTV